MKKILNQLLTFSKILFFVLIFFTLFDFVLGKFIYKKFLRKNFIDVNSKIPVYIDSTYDHTLGKGLDQITGNIRYRICTDQNGFRTFCNNTNNRSKNYDIAIIGDSFTEGVGLNYEETFVGIFSKKIGEKNVANLGVSSYSPSIYYLKIKDLIKKKYKFKEVIVFVDLSDLVDETSCYNFSENTITRRDNYHSCINLGVKFFDKDYLNYLKHNLTLSFQAFVLVKEFLISKDIIKKTPSSYQLNSPRSSWTFNYKEKLYNNYSLDEAKQLMVSKMDLLYNLLKINNIQLSLAVYPWPNTIYYDNSKNVYFKMWSDFCLDKCKNFYDFNPVFFNQLRTSSKDEVIIKNFLEEDVHFNAHGSKLIGINFYEQFLKQNNLK